MNFYEINIYVPTLHPKRLIVQAAHAPPLAMIMKRLLLDESAEIHVRQINVVTWEVPV